MLSISHEGENVEVAELQVTQLKQISVNLNFMTKIISEIFYFVKHATNFSTVHHFFSGIFDHIQEYVLTNVIAVTKLSQLHRL